MSVKNAQDKIEQVQRDIASLQKKLADETNRESSKSRRIQQIKRTITHTTRPSVLRQKQSNISRLEGEIATSQSRQTEINKNLARKTATLYRYQEQLADKQMKEQRKFRADLKRREQAAQQQQADLLHQINLSNHESTMTTSAASIADETPRYDVFISHASEDKDELVRPLAEQLQIAGFNVWYDEFQLKVGDSLRRSIDKGLANSRFGIVVLSTAFFDKNWPQYELDGLVTREMTGGKVILPLWHKVSKNEVIQYSPTLADKVALNTSMYTIDELVEKLGEVLR